MSEDAKNETPHGCDCSRCQQSTTEIENLQRRILLQNVVIKEHELITAVAIRRGRWMTLAFASTSALIGAVALRALYNAVFDSTEPAPAAPAAPA